MKFDANIEWVIDDNQLGIACGSTEDVAIDIDYTEANENDIIAEIEYELERRYGVSFKNSKSENDDGDYVVTNMEEVLDDIKFEEFQEKTQYTRM